MRESVKVKGGEGDGITKEGNEVEEVKRWEGGGTEGGKGEDLES
jgi:hypothetical protein